MIEKIVYILGKRRAIKFVLFAFLMVLGALIDTALTYAILPLTSLITSVDNYATNSYYILLEKYLTVSNFSEAIAIYAIIIAASYIFRNVYMLIVNGLRYRFLAESKAYVSTNLFSTIANKPYSYFTATNTSAIQRICINDVSRLFGVIDSCLNVIINFITLVLIAAVLLAENTLLTVSATVILGLLTVLVNRPIAKKTSELSKVYSEHYTSMLQWTQQFVGSLKTVLTTEKQPFFVERFSYHNKRFTQNEGRFSFISLVTGYVLNAVVMGLGFFYVAVLAIQGENITLYIPTLALFAMAAMKLMPSISSFATHLNNIRYNEQGLYSIYEQMKNNEKDAQQIYSNIMIESNDESQTLTEGIKIDDISFHFEDTQNDLFKHMSLEIPGNKSVAFIGTTGSGKTTLADIILGLHKPYAGTITADGHDIFCEHEWWASQIGYIPQTIYLCEDSIRANVAFGIPEQNINDNKVRECLKKAQILDFIDKLPEKEYTVTGENGIKLSGGQRQRIGIARALYNNPPFLVFDEATSALDVDTEKAIMDTVNSLAGEKTMLIIAHRLTTIQKCDIVYKIENGKCEKVEEVYE